jgi:hypothetical protein
MRRIVLMVTVALVMALMMVAAPAFASHQGSEHQCPPDPDPLAHPFCGSGEEYAHGHVVGLAQGQQIMAPEAGGVHNPGLAHEGFTVCDPSDSDPFE